MSATLGRVETRDRSLDIAKAIAIIAIVVGHVWRGLHSASMIEDEKLFSAVEQYLYIWHLSVFAFAAGLFVRRGMARDGKWHYACSRDLAFIWVYLVWTVVQGAVKLGADSLVNVPTSATELFTIWRPDGQLWFFGWISAAMIIAAALAPWRSRGWSASALLVALALSVAVWGNSAPYFGTQGHALTVYFVVGLVWRGDRLLNQLKRISVPVAAGTSAVCLGVMLVLAPVGTPPTIEGSERTALSVLVGVVASTMGLAGVLLASRVISLWPGSRYLAVVGKRSLVVYTGHMVLGPGARIVLNGLGIGGVVLHLVAGVVAGVLGSLLLYWMARRLRFMWLFEPPAFVTRLLPPVPAPVRPAADG
ncbi:MAG: acyltransferase [Bifidobacteriaceae bacterium]|jgi:fucose 4-O-acetylase-like acetyltransferase|nr:acyltransferase [Bifidobacteriaceae bacterium]